MAIRDELVAATSSRYGASRRDEKKRILDEFVAVTGFHRKHAMRLLRSGPVRKARGSRPERRLYDDAVRAALIVIWEASDRICGKRLGPLVPLLVEAMERHDHLRLDPEVRRQLLAMSAATIDRALRDAKAGSGRRHRGGPVSAVRRSIPVRTFSDWGDPPPGFCEVDLVWHSGPTAKGSFVQTLVVTDIATGWTECAPLLVREQKLLTEVLTEIRKLLPFALLGFDTDNDSVFINETVRDYCLAQNITFTRCRPYRPRRLDRRARQSHHLRSHRRRQKLAGLRPRPQSLPGQSLGPLSTHPQAIRRTRARPRRRSLCPHRSRARRRPASHPR